MTFCLRFFKVANFPVITFALVLFSLLEIQAQPPSPLQTPLQTSPQPTAPATPPSPSITAETLQNTAETIQKRIEQVKELKDLAEENQKKALEFYNQALENLKKTVSFQKSAFADAAKTQDAMQRLNNIKAEIESLSKQPTPSYSHMQNLTELEQDLVKEEPQLEKAKQDLANWDAEIARRANRQKEALLRISEIDEKINEIDKQLKVPAPAEEPAPVADARKQELTTRLNLLKAEKPALKNELTSYDAEEAIGFPRINQDYLKLLAKRQKEKVDALKEQITKRRKVESEMRVREAREKVFATNPLLQPLAEKNQTYAEEIQKLNQKIESVDQKSTQTDKILEDLKKQYDQTIQKEKSVGLTGPIGLLLRNQQATLPNIETHEQNIEIRSKLIDEVHLKTFELDDEWADFPTAEAKTAEILKSSKRDLTAEEETDLENIVEETLAKQKEYLDTLIRSNRNYFDKLLNLDVAERALVRQTEEYSDYIQERIFWIKSSSPLSVTELKQTSHSIRWLFSPTRWKELSKTIQEDIYNNPIIYVTAFCCFLSLVYLAYNVREQLRIINKEIIRSS